jgi:hypothetical protein
MQEVAMKRIVAIGILLVTLITVWTPPAQAGAAVDAALALGAFAVFNQFLAGFGIFGVPWAYAAPAYYPSYYYPAYPYPSYAYAPSVYTVPPPRYYAAAHAANYAPPAAAPAANYAPPAAAQTEVVYPHGRYVLRGDGINVAYRWVWVPNPPLSSPPAAPRTVRY